MLEWRRVGRVEGRWVGGGQFKAVADQLAHLALEQELKALSLTVPILSEEDPKSLAEARPQTYWLIDPIDGTASFAQGLDGFVTQVALMRNGCPELAAVYAPATDEIFLAEAGRGATRNGEALRVRHRRLDEATLTDNYPEPRGVARELMDALSIPLCWLFT